MYKGNPDIVRFNGQLRHKTKWMVKHVSGPRVGHLEICDSEEAAKIECYYLADHGVCPFRIPPLYSEEN